MEKAEAILLEIRGILDKSAESDEGHTKVKQLSDDFYTALPHHPSHRVEINSKRALARKQELCQVGPYTIIGMFPYQKRLAERKKIKSILR